VIETIEWLNRQCLSVSLKPGYDGATFWLPAIFGGNISGRRKRSQKFLPAIFFFRIYGESS
jgi:hypothetical protein